MKPMLAALLLIAASMAATSVVADLIVYEPFDYLPGMTNPEPAAGVNNGAGLPATNTGGDPAGTGTGLRGEWGAATIVTNGLTHPKLRSADQALFIPANQNMNPATVWIYRFMTTDPFARLRSEASPHWLGADGQQIWGSLLVQLGSTEAGTRFQLRLEGKDGAPHSQIRISTVDGGRWTLTQQNTSAGDAPGATVTVNESAPASRTVTLLVWQHTFGSGNAASGQDTFKLWINPDPAALGEPHYVLNTDGEVGFAGIGYDTRGNTGTIVDELRIGTTAADVTPTP